MIKATSKAVASGERTDVHILEWIDECIKRFPSLIRHSGGKRVDHIHNLREDLLLLISGLKSAVLLEGYLAAPSSRFVLLQLLQALKKHPFCRDLYLLSFLSSSTTSTRSKNEQPNLADKSEEDEEWKEIKSKKKKSKFKQKNSYPSSDHMKEDRIIEEKIKSTTTLEKACLLIHQKNLRTRIENEKEDTFNGIQMINVDERLREPRLCSKAERDFYVARLTHVTSVLGSIFSDSPLPLTPFSHYLQIPLSSLLPISPPSSLEASPSIPSPPSGSIQSLPCSEQAERGKLEQKVNSVAEKDLQEIQHGDENITDEEWLPTLAGWLIGYPSVYTLGFLSDLHQKHGEQKIRKGKKNCLSCQPLTVSLVALSLSPSVLEMSPTSEVHYKKKIRSIIPLYLFSIPTSLFQLSASKECVNQLMKSLTARLLKQSIQPPLFSSLPQLNFSSQLSTNVPL